MKVALLASFLLLTGPVQAQTQMQMNEAACQKWQQADKKLNVLYQQVLKLYASDATFIKAFKASQVVWLKFRDAQEEALFPTRPGQQKQVSTGRCTRCAAVRC